MDLGMNVDLPGGAVTPRSGLFATSLLLGILALSLALAPLCAGAATCGSLGSDHPHGLAARPLHAAPRHGTAIAPPTAPVRTAEARPDARGASDPNTAPKCALKETASVLRI
jgi:hypothetical protein